MSRRSLPKTGTVRYLHVSVQVKAPELGKPAMRTTPGKGATARRKAQQQGEPIGRQRRRQQRAEREAREQAAKSADAPR
jgi:hypothetical protein